MHSENPVLWMTLSFEDDSRKADLSHSSPRGKTLSQPVAVGFIDAWLPPGTSVQPSDRGVHIGSRHGASSACSSSWGYPDATRGLGRVCPFVQTPWEDGAWRGPGSARRGSPRSSEKGQAYLGPDPLRVLLSLTPSYSPHRPPSASEAWQYSKYSDLVFVYPSVCL